jgi:hypothetical protein
MMLVMINTLNKQKRLEQTWATEIKEPKYIAITLDTSSVTKAFVRIETILTCVWVAMGVLLVYVVRHQLISEDKDDDPPFGERTQFIPSSIRRQLPMPPS